MNMCIEISLFLPERRQRSVIWSQIPHYGIDVVVAEHWPVVRAVTFLHRATILDPRVHTVTHVKVLISIYLITIKCQIRKKKIISVGPNSAHARQEWWSLPVAVIAVGKCNAIGACWIKWGPSTHSLAPNTLEVLKWTRYPFNCWPQMCWGPR